MHVPHMLLQIAPFVQMLKGTPHMGCLPHVYMADDDEDDQNRRQKGIWNGWTACPWTGSDLLSVHPKSLSASCSDHLHHHQPDIHGVHPMRS